MAKKRMYDSNAEKQRAYRVAHGKESLPEAITRLSIAIRRAAGAGNPLAKAAVTGTDNPDDFKLVAPDVAQSQRTVTKMVRNLTAALEKDALERSKGQ